MALRREISGVPRCYTTGNLGRLALMTGLQLPPFALSGRLGDRSEVGQLWPAAQAHATSGEPTSRRPINDGPPDPECRPLSEPLLRELQIFARPTLCQLSRIRASPDRLNFLPLHARRKP